MKGKGNLLYCIGVLLLVFGGAGLAEISTSNHGCFWLCDLMFGIGVGCCLLGYTE